MDSNRKTAVIVGILFIIGTVSGILSVVFTGSILNAPDLLQKVSNNEQNVVIGALFLLVMCFSLAMIPVLMYPIAKKQNELLAIGYVVFRGALETMTGILIVMSWLLLLPLSREFVLAKSTETPNMIVLGKMLQSFGNLPILVIVFSLGALMFYYLLFESKLIPRWLSIWGIIAIILHLISGLLILFGMQSGFSVSNMIMNFPIFLQEMVMAVWFIVKGFNRSEFKGE
jgi:hypothetical protein